MALFSRKNIKSNPFGLTEDDIKGSIKDFPMGVVVRMLEEQKLQGNEPDIKVFCEYGLSDKFLQGFDWDKTEDEGYFWVDVIKRRDFGIFFEKYPEYERYNIS